MKANLSRSKSLGFSTYQLHLTLQPTNQVKFKLANLVRKLQGKAAKLVVDNKFFLVKKKLYIFLVTTGLP